MRKKIQVLAGVAFALLAAARPAGAAPEWFAHAELIEPSREIYYIGSDPQSQAYVDFSSIHWGGFTQADPNEFIGTVLLEYQLGWDDNSGAFSELDADDSTFFNVSADDFGIWVSPSRGLQVLGAAFGNGDYQAIAKTQISDDGTETANETDTRPFLVR